MSRELAKEFVKRLEGIDRSKRRTEVFRDFCELAYCALAKTAALSAERADELEAQYMGVVARYRNKEDVRAMPALLETATRALSYGGCDFLGTVAGEIGALDSGLGQFFTPYEVSRLIAGINLTDATAFIEENGFLTLSEPAAGAGGMVIAAADVLEEQHINIGQSLWVEAIELNRGTFHMAYVQLALRGVAGRVINGNSLSLETHEFALTPAALGFLARHGHPFKKQKEEAAKREAGELKREEERAERLEGMAKAQPTAPAVQLSLFD